MKNFIFTLLFCFVFALSKALEQDTIAYQNLEIPKHIFIKNKAVPISVGILGVGLALEFSKADRYWWQNKYSFQSRVQKTYSGFTTNADDFLRYAPFAIAAGLNLSKAKAKHKIVGQVTRLISAQLLMDLTVTRLKRHTRHIRPSGGIHSFPSAHTSQAFLAARFLDKEFGKHHKWVRWIGYSMAVTTGTCRVLSNAHWFSDVLVGAGIGILSVDLTYFVFDKLGSKKLKISPMAGKDIYGLNLVYRF